MPKYNLDFSNSESGSGDDELLEQVQPPHARAPIVPFVPEVRPPGSLPIAKRTRLLPPPPADWEFLPEVLMGDGATAADVAVARAFGKEGMGLPTSVDGGGTSAPFTLATAPCAMYNNTNV